ncbi:DET1- and DDB1-associated protein 1-like [Pollicipes pollicipes]|uniref:DET1- and DDB1-associated protein 1-like n=1 Tax=Pollicipes pollicipes TaxID=41117 RepID=UPI00188542E4|nr:DET1- and DDB1-associated protein 1-like [Pollicipes pollicipes]
MTGKSSEEGSSPARSSGSNTNQNVPDFLRGLPCRDSKNFSKFSADSGPKASGKKAPIYMPTTDHPSAQVIVTEKTNILLRYLHWRWEKKLQDQSKKRSAGSADVDEGASARKRARSDRADTSP